MLRLCERAGLVKLGHVALDGTKVKANASKHKAMSYERMGKRAEELEAEVAAWMDAAAKADASEDAAFGRDKSGEEMPAWVGDKKRRAEKIRAAKAELEAEARAAAEAERKARAEAEKKREAEGRKKPGRPAAPPSEDPDPKAQKNFTDPESRIMKTKDGFIQGYNAQAAVDAEAQVIVAHGLDANGSDQHQLTPMVDAVEANMGRKPEEVSADAGYCSDANLAAMEERAIDAYIAAGRAKHPTDGEGGSKRVADMREKIKAGGHESPYRLRKQLPEPVFGQIKQARGFRQFLMRGLDKVAHEWGLVCLAHNMLKLAQGRSLSAADLATRLTPASPPKSAKPANSAPRPAHTPSRCAVTRWTLSGQAPRVRRASFDRHVSNSASRREATFGDLRSHKSLPAQTFPYGQRAGGVHGQSGSRQKPSVRRQLRSDVRPHWRAVLPEARDCLRQKVRLRTQRPGVYGGSWDKAVPRIIVRRHLTAIDYVRGPRPGADEMEGELRSDAAAPEQHPVLRLRNASLPTRTGKQFLRNTIALRRSPDRDVAGRRKIVAARQFDDIGANLKWRILPNHIAGASRDQDYAERNDMRKALPLQAHGDQG